jgi:hypothetical protein
MGHSGSFGVSDVYETVATLEWEGIYAQLALLCHRVKMTNREAQVVNLYCRGMSYRQIGHTLGMKNPKTTKGLLRRHLHHAVSKIETYLPSLQYDRQKYLRDLLECLRNRRLGGEPPRVLYDSNGREVGARAKPFGTRPEDLLEWSPEEVIYCLADRLQQEYQRRLEKNNSGGIDKKRYTPRE